MTRSCRDVSKYTFPGAAHSEKTVASLSSLEDLYQHQSVLDAIADIKKNMDEHQAMWDRAHDARYNYPPPHDYRLRDAIWKALYPDTPYFEHVDTMEIAAMRCRVFDIFDAVDSVVYDLIYEAREEAKNEQWRADNDY
jgi:hypothetical protein